MNRETRISTALLKWAESPVARRLQKMCPPHNPITPGDLYEKVVNAPWLGTATQLPDDELTRRVGVTARRRFIDHLRKENNQPKSFSLSPCLIDREDHHVQ